MAAPVMVMEEDLAALFGEDDDFEDDDFSNNDSEGVEEEEVWEEQVGAQVEQGQQTATQRDETIVELTQQVQVLQAVMQQRDAQIQQLQTMVLAVQPPSVYEVGGPSTVAAEGPSFPLPAPRLPILPSVIEDLSTRLGSCDGVPDGSCYRQIGAGCDAAERRSDLAAADYGL
nr:hypothetical protein [Tanacetum cinerariifolium]